MTYSVLICDDSALARKQMAKSLPDGLAREVNFATNGQEAVDFIAANPVDLMFLDLTMPELDGYQVLEHLKAQGVDLDVIVVSGDIQPEAHNRVMSLGARAFIKKPAAPALLESTLSGLGFEASAGAPAATSDYANITVDLQDSYREVVNVAMGQAADKLARLLNVFIKLPVPRVSFIEPSEIQMALEAVSEQQSLSAVCQGFIGSGISGEAMLLFADSDFSNVGQLMNYQVPLSETDSLDVLMDMANILISVCLKGIAEQLDIEFSQGHPVVLGQHCSIADLVAKIRQKSQQLLAIEISYDLENQPITCDLLLLFTPQSVPALNSRVSLIME
ncbi:response regulator [Pokkaliibacter sp. CJK22405]|uniref:response regulator n=1 Tax=Pokkaliibacter sp. CJK22405 TaxID=3384615 RepID=UPI0039855C17